MPLAGSQPTPGRSDAARRGPLVDRERLLARLAGAGTPVVVIEAPVGFGKSTLLAQWRATAEDRFAAVALGAHHNDPVLLIAAIAGAAAEVTEVPDDVFAALHGSDPAVLGAVPRLQKALARAPGPVILALDDVHALTDPMALAVIAALARDVPGGTRLVLATRRRPEAGLGRLRANRRLTELSARDLAMTRLEASAMLEACGLSLRPDSVELLVEHTDGWPAALYLAALTLAASEDPDLAAADFTGDYRIVADYFREELLPGFGADQLDFLTRSSVLDELSADACDAVLATEGSGAMLRRIARSNSLLRPLDTKDRSYRCHALLREMLGSELGRLDPSEGRGLHARAARWYGDRGDHEHAVPHAIASGDVEAAGALIWSHTTGHAGFGRTITLSRWLDGFTATEIEATPTLCLARAACGLSAGDGAEVEHWTGLALALLEGRKGAADRRLRITAAAIRASGAAREGLAPARRDVREAFALLDGESPWRALCRLIEGVSLHLCGEEHESARRALEDGARRGANGAPALEALCLAQLALLALDDGDVDEAVRLTERAVHGARLYGLDHQPACALVFGVGALVEAGRGRADAAARDVRTTLGLLGSLHEMSAWYESETRIVLARALVRLEDVGGARAQLAEAGRMLRRTPDAPVLREWVALASGEVDQASASGRWPLSPAELRLLHYLPTHLTFRDVADELFVSANTVKSQARSIYRKLGVSSRASAVAHARAAGLLPPDGVHPVGNGDTGARPDG
jgi:LuxR family maltose regulon positive regulatory protein